MKIGFCVVMNGDGPIGIAIGGDGGDKSSREEEQDGKAKQKRSIRCEWNVKWNVAMFKNNCKSRNFGTEQSTFDGILRTMTENPEPKKERPNERKKERERKKVRGKKSDAFVKMH